MLDINQERREIVGGLAGRMLRRSGWQGNLLITGDQDAALDGANYVLIQLRVGGQQARLSDETLPHQFGIIGQETTGPGGFAKALRTVPVILDVAEAARRRAAADHSIVDFTNSADAHRQHLPLFAAGAKSGSAS